MEKNKTRAEHVETWKSSGLTRVEYARRHGLNYGTFKGWVYERNKNHQKIEWACEFCLFAGKGSLLQTAKANGKEPYKFLLQFLKSLPHCQTQQDCEKLFTHSMDGVN